MSKAKSTKETLNDHSIAKVKLYELYLSIYLNILDRANFVRQIIIADLFAGEGIYKDGGKGSPIKAFEVIQKHLSSGINAKKILFLINDPEKSKIEVKKYKVERIQDCLENFETHSNLTIKYSKAEFNRLIPEILDIMNSMRHNDRALFFIDPWGYKEIRPTDLKQLISNEKIEILLFLPISFMYRFSKTAIEVGFRGSEPLEVFLEELFGKDLNKILNINKVDEFIIILRERFKKYLSLPYVDDFKLTTEDGNTYCLYFFSFNKIGYQKMIEAKWRIDEEYGRGFKYEENFNLFSGAYSEAYREKLFNFIKISDGRTNDELLDFGFENRFLPKHTNKILKEFKDDCILKVESLDGLPIKSFYIGNKKRKVKIKIK